MVRPNLQRILFYFEWRFNEWFLQRDDGYIDCNQHNQSYWHTLHIYSIDFQQGHWWSFAAKVQRLRVFIVNCNLWLGRYWLLTVVCACVLLPGGLRGASIIDSLDTLYIMGLMDEYNDAKEWVKTSLDLNSVRSSLFAPLVSPLNILYPRWAPRRLHFQPDKDFSGGRACRIDYKRRLCVLTATLCRRSLTVLQSLGHRCVNHKHSVWPLDTPC